MSKTNIGILLFLVVTLLLAGYFTYLTLSNNKSSEADNAKQLFRGVDGVETYTDLNGSQVDLDQYLGKVLVVSTWASWSPFSASDLEELDQFARSYDSDDVVIISLNRKEPKEQALRYLASLPQLDSIVMVIDSEDHFYNSLGGYAMPETIVFDESGEVRLHQRGEVRIPEIEETVNLLLK